MNETYAPGAEWNASLSGNFLWSNTNFGEAVTEPMTPLAWSVLAFSLDDWIFVPRHPTVGNIAGLPYLNISVFATLFHFLGRDRAAVFEAMESTVYMRLPEGLEIPRVPLPWWGRFASFWLATRVQYKQRRGIQQLGDYLSSNPGWFVKTRNQLLDIKTGKELIQLWQEQIKPHVKRGVWIVLGTATYSADYTNQLRRELVELVGPQDATILVGHFTGASSVHLPEIDVESGWDAVGYLLPSLGPVIGLSLLASGKISLERYLETYGHRGPHEFEISHPRPVENPDWLSRQLERLRESPVDVEAMLNQQRTAYIVTLERLKRQFPREAPTLKARIAESARRGHLREQARSEYVRDRWMVRLFACRAGDLCGLGEDIFFLTLKELQAVLSGNDEPIAHIPARKYDYERMRTLPVLPSIICGSFDPQKWMENPDRRTDYYDGKSITKKVGAIRQIEGSPGSAGQVEGIVRVVLKAEDAHFLCQGEILVTVQTDIAWTLVFPRAGAVVTDVGAPLSHTAIVARELGIPAVVGCGDATQRLRTGERVRVDGARGIVEVIQ